MRIMSYYGYGLLSHFYPGFVCFVIIQAQIYQVIVYRTGPTIGSLVLIFAQNIDCGYMLKPPHLGGSNEYLQYIF